MPGRDDRLFHRINRTARQAFHPSDGAGPYRTPPFLTFDPAIESERRAAQRGLRDTAQDVRRAARRSRRDIHTQLRDIHTEKKRGLQDIGFEKADVRLQRQRGRQDFNLQLDSLTRKYTQLGNTQLQAANAAGVLDSGTSAASAAARAQNFAFERTPIDIGRARLEEDTQTALERLGVQQHRLVQDVRHDRRLTKREGRQTLQDLYSQLERAIREQRIGDVDLIKQEIFDARQRNPGQFSKMGRRGN